MNENRLNETNEDISVLLDKRNAYIMNEEGMFVKNARAILDSKQGQAFLNKETGIIALFSSVGKNKILSNAATEKSIRNGFTIGQHNEVASKIDKLFQYAYLMGSSPDKNGDTNIASIKRFVAPVILKYKDGKYEDCSCYITVKENFIFEKKEKKTSHRIYSVEEIKIEQLPNKGADIQKNCTIIHSPTVLSERIIQEEEKIKKFDKVVSDIFQIQNRKEYELPDKNPQQNENIWNVANTLIDWGCDTLGASEMMKRLFNDGYSPEELQMFFNREVLDEEFKLWEKEEQKNKKEKQK